MDRPIVRLATKEDIPGILEVHYSAVHRTAAQDYPADICNQWSPRVTQHRIDKYFRESFSNETTLVAEDNSTIAAFGSIIARINALVSLYVAAKFANRGLGLTLLKALEHLARENGCTELRVNATLTGRGFYLRNGYDEIGPGEYAFRPDCKMTIIKMRKVLHPEAGACFETIGQPSFRHRP